MVIETYYTSENNEFSLEKEEQLSGEYHIGKLVFQNRSVGLIPKDFASPNFKENFDGLIGILKRENLLPITKEEWEKWREIN